jgi:DNA-binding NarL/FixJ family response regulator
MSRRNANSSARILLIDDSAVMRSALRPVLEEYGWTVCGEAANGREAIEKALELNPSLILMDVAMPVMDGLSAARELGKLLPQLPILFMSQHGQKPYRDEALALGAKGYLFKWEMFDTLIPAVKTVLAGGTCFWELKSSPEGRAAARAKSQTRDMD